MTDIFNDDFVEYVQLLNKHNVEYVLLGGMAVNLHGYRRSTGDMDLFVNPTVENHSKLKRVHVEFGMMMGEMESIENFTDTAKFDVYTFGVSPVQIDIMTACKGISFDQAYDNFEIFDIAENVTINVVEYNVLIQAKKAANRTRDIADIEELIKGKQSKDRGRGVKVLTFRRDEFERMLHSKSINEDNIESTEGEFFISIIDSGAPQLMNDKSNFLTLQFDDVEKSIPGKVKTLSPTDSKILNQFIQNNRDKEYLFVHCSAGISRSGTIGKYVVDVLNGDELFFKKNNKHIDVKNYFIERLLSQKNN